MVKSRAAPKLTTGIGAALRSTRYRRLMLFSSVDTLVDLKIPEKTF
jgi:hypothetical protein